MDVNIRRNNTARLLDKMKTKRNAIWFNPGNTLEHEMAKARIAYFLLKTGKDIVTEAVFLNGKRADIVVLDDCQIIEILHSETLEDCLIKMRSYPDEFKKIAYKSSDVLEGKYDGSYV
jgi:hypothetical protein